MMVTSGEIVIKLAVTSGDGDVVVHARNGILVESFEIVHLLREVNITSLGRSHGTVRNDGAEIPGLMPSLVLLKPCE